MTKSKNHQVTRSISLPFNANGRMMTPHEKRTAMKLLRERDGKGCQMRKGRPRHDGHRCKGKPRIDHINNIDTDNRPENLQELCHGHNTRKNPRGKSRFHSSRIHNSLKDNKKSVSETEAVTQSERETVSSRKRISEVTRYKERSIREQAWKKFAEEVERILRKEGPMPRWKLIINASAGTKTEHEPPISQKTGGDYLDQLEGEYTEDRLVEYYPVIMKGKEITYVRLWTNGRRKKHGTA